jgi:hypothetical protein
MSTNYWREADLSVPIAEGLHQITCVWPTFKELAQENRMQ